MRHVHVVLTGFSKFNGVDDNPTEILVNWLREELSSSTTGILDEVKFEYIDTVKVSAEAVDSTLPEIEQKIHQLVDTQADIIWVHLGVNVRGQVVHLEKVAYNEANFRVPDEEGWQPSHLPIDDSAPLGAPMRTRLPLHAITNALKAAGHKVCTSTDPGRFVCNYIYYRSLQRHSVDISQASTQQQSPNTLHTAPTAPTAPTVDTHRSPLRTSLFVHVPPFHAVPQEEQQACLLGLLQQVATAALQPQIFKNNNQPSLQPNLQPSLQPSCPGSSVKPVDDTATPTIQPVATAVAAAIDEGGDVAVAADAIQLMPLDLSTLNVVFSSAAAV